MADSQSRPAAPGLANKVAARQKPRAVGSTRQADAAAFGNHLSSSTALDHGASADTPLCEGGLALRLAKLIRWLLPALLLAMAGCGAAATTQPTVRIVTPINGLKETASSSGPVSVTVHLSISHFTLLLPGESGTAGSGQVDLYDNGKLLIQTATTSFPLFLQPGTYTLKAVLVTNGKTVASSAPTVVSVLPAPTPIPTPTPTPISCAHTPQPSAGLQAGTISLFCNGLPTAGSVRDLAAGPGGDLWFTTYAASGRMTPGIGRITPSGTITIFDQGLPANSEVGGIRMGPDGNLWFPTCLYPKSNSSQGCANGTVSIARVTASGAITLYHVRLSAGDQVVDLMVSPAGGLWFEVAPNDPCGYSPGAAPCPLGTAIGHISASGVITMFDHGLSAKGSLGPPYVAPNGDLWFASCPRATGFSCAQSPSIGRLTPAGALTLYPTGVPATTYSTFGFYNFTQHDGSLWFSAGPDIGRITAAGTITWFSKGLPAGSSISGFTVGRDGDLWFTVQPVSSNGTFAIGQITPSGVITMFKSQGVAAGGSVSNLVTGPGGNLWFTVSPSSGGIPGIGRITPSGVITVFSQGLPPQSTLGHLVMGPVGDIWFTVAAPSVGGIGRITPSGAITVFKSQGVAAGGDAGNLVAGPDGNLWFVVPPEAGCGFVVTNAIGRIVP